MLAKAAFRLRPVNKHPDNSVLISIRLAPILEIQGLF